jgi:geranylgeranyl pyrophosphate synthase
VTSPARIASLDARPRERTPEVAALDASLDPAALAAALELPAAVPVEIWHHALIGPARELVARPGKRFRARLVEIAWRIAGGDGAVPPLFVSVVELLHAGSLIVDDIEDDATARRGAPALHLVVGTALALNTGNWLYCWPSQLVTQAELPPAVELAVHRDVQRCLVRCHHGQALDLATRIGAMRRADVPCVVAAIARLKTGALLALAARLGARAAGADDPTVASLGDFGHALGEGLQMLDDLGSLRTPAKASEDLGLGRCTWPWAWLAERADDTTWAQLTRTARTLDRGDANAVAALAGELARQVGDHGRDVAHGHLIGALERLRAHIGERPELAAIEAEISRLEVSYG